MKLTDQRRGYIFALIATVAMANVYVFSKAALNEISLYQFGFYWFGMAMVWNLLYALPAGKINRVKFLRKKDFRVLLILGVMELVGTSLFFASIETTSSPANMSFLQNLVPLFVILMGVSFLGERFSGFQVLGVVVILAGALVTSFSGNITETGFFVPGSGFMIASTIFLAGTTIISKKYITNLDPGLLSFNRALFLFILSLILMLAFDQPFRIEQSAFLNTMIGSLLGPFLTAFSTFSALRYIDASKSTIIQSSKGLFVTIGAWIYFSSVPRSFQIMGGLLTIIGVIILISAREKSDQKKGGPVAHPSGENTIA
ncbi:MAG: DMT family transporter [Bacteroidia bacterium]|nr:MAG: DMT family transporter [Bacteroidia bacterium]